MTTNTVQFHRVFTTTPEKIYRAFTQADAFARWLPPNGYTARVHAMDMRRMKVSAGSLASMADSVSRWT